ncbi:hypothetical protein [Mycobacterium sp. NPDC050853]|uniref:CDGP domain-containing protein n=1 Tax=Mycobacterium sp. NPDC050853 TaxID=3155160 RepID=UPI0033ED4C36
MPSQESTREGKRRVVVRRLFVGMLAGAVLAMTAVGYAQRAHAAPEVGCETTSWGLFGSQLRTICDGPKRPDGSWIRERRIWTSAGWVRGSTYCGYYSCTRSEGYYRSESTQTYERYLVFDDNVLGDEPGWLPAGTVVVR